MKARTEAERAAQRDDNSFIFWYMGLKIWRVAQSNPYTSYMLSKLSKHLILRWTQADLKTR